MLRTELLLIGLVTTATIIRGAPIDGDEPPPTDVEPRGPLSKIVFVSDLPARQDSYFVFNEPMHMFVATARDDESRMYEINIQLFDSDNESDRTNMVDASDRMDERRRKQTVFQTPKNRITIRNNNSGRSNSKTPGIIYFCSATNDNYRSTVYEPLNLQDFQHSANRMDHEYVTFLNPSGAVKISYIRHIQTLNQLAITAGGVEEAQTDSNRIYTVTSDEIGSKAPVFIFEPVVTFQKMITVFATDFELAAEAVETKSEIIIPIDWSEWSLAMSPNYKLRNESSSIRYVFNATNENTQYDLNVLGYIGNSSQLSISIDGYDGRNTQLLSQQHFEHEYLNRKGRLLTIEYKRGREENKENHEGVVVRIRCKQPSASVLLYSVFCLVILQHLFY